MNEFRVGDLDRRGSEELLKSFFADAAVGLSITDLQGRFVQVNPAYCSLTGYTEAELEARDFQSLTHPDDLPRTMAKVQSLLSGEISSFLIEKRYIRKDAIVVWVLNSVSVIRDNAGRPTNLVRLSQDITERMQLVDSLRQAEARTESILESIADVHVLFDRNWRYVYVNEAAVRAIGRPREQILGRTLWELFPDIVGTELEREYRRAMDERVTVNIDSYYEARDNWWENRFYPVPIGLALFATDITERKHAEEELRRAKEFSEKLIQTANVIVLGLDMKGKINIFNQTAEKITGYAFSELEGKSWFETLVPKDKYPHVWEEFSRLVASDKVPSTFENPILTKNGEERYIAWRNNRVRMDGKVVGFISFGNDITERKQAEERLREYEKVVEGLEEMIVVVDRDYRYLLANRAFLKHRGMEREQLVGRSVPEILNQGLFDEVIKPKLDECFQGKVVRYEMNYSYPEIGERVLAISYFPIEGPHGVDQAALVLQDITERRRAGAALREAEQKYRDIFENAGEGIFQSTREGRYIAANPALARMHGFDSPEELIRDRSDISTQIYVDPERREEFKRLLEEQGAVRGFEHQVFRKDGSKIWISVNARAVRDGQGRILYYEGTSQDISERREAEAALLESEQELRLFNLATNDMFWNWEFATGKVARSMGFERAFGYSELEINPLISWWEERLHPDDKERVLTEFRGALQRGDKACSYEYRFRRYDGSYATISDRAYIVRDESGNAVRAMGAMTDITERKRAEATVKDSEARYRSLFENMAEGCAYCRMLFEDGQPQDFIYLAVNEAFGKLTGLSDVVGKKVSDVIPGVRESAAKFFEVYGRVALTGRPERFKAFLEPIQMWLSVSVYSPAEEHFVAVFENITERQQAEAALWESEERYRDLVENSRELICTHDLDGRVLSANRAAAEALGYDSNELEGKNIRDILAPEVRHEFEQYMASLRERGATSGVMLVETSTGERRMWEYYNSLRTEGVATPVVRGMALDITERRRAEAALRKSEERYRELFENAKDAIYVHDLGGRYKSFNRAAEQLSGYTRDEIIGKHFSNFVSPRSLKDVRENLCKKLDEVGETTYEIDLVRKDRSRVPVEVISRLIYENGKPVGIQGVARDISDRRRAQDALRTYSQRLIEAQEAERQNIARELHDEIGQVLTAVRMNLQSLQRSAQSGSQPSAVDDSLVIVDEALERVRELSLNLRPSVLDSLGLSSALRWYVDRYARRSGIVADLRSNLEDGRRLRVELETACFRIVQEALTNVVRHARATHVLVRLRRSNGNLDLKIRDNGVGFNVETLLKDSPSAGALGLRGMEERAVAVHGRLKIESAPMRGTEVRASFPL